ncbi:MULTISPECIES: YceD family protein [unclassified Pseudoclavibacter]|uniref:YceD family protein n=1 Tax=unclassified Pseudoclavibacter TaxID=2615177 RepID=UPI0013013746|nr:MULTISPECIES: YceD family protein [unclassified Pseudoclavibacter]KAB1645711.1 DUF177 domain-containing protein [Pseudoclavibacter sp. CFCC 14310]KAB1658652.1 DUF177 domain-containing protein [Pseudoclavibacter sp. CFCC 11306]KAB1661286.1 DUF177 domain-containing protein [Pseudoclavibacter sp. CFCC 13796]KAB1664381.1 DUF177 domain-containing protein [Pseudoclavibacter sp. CFCC 13611]
MANPYLINVHDLVGKPGAMRSLQVTVPAEADLGVGLARVTEGSPIEADLRLESVHEGILVTATIDFEVVGESSRTLEPLSWRDEVEFRDLFAYPDSEAALTRDDGDGEIQVLQNEHVDLSQSIRDAIVLNLPLKPVGDEPAAEIYSIGDPIEPAVADEIDPRWADLGKLAQLPNDASSSRADSEKE